MRGMSVKQRLFVEEYLINLNATQAAIRAGYKEANANQIGYQLLHKASVSEAIAEAKARRSERTAITQDYVLQKLKREIEREIDTPGPNAARVSALKILAQHLGMLHELDSVEKLLSRLPAELSLAIRRGLATHYERNGSAESSGDTATHTNGFHRTNGAS